MGRVSPDLPSDCVVSGAGQAVSPAGVIRSECLTARQQGAVLQALRGLYSRAALSLPVVVDSDFRSELMRSTVSPYSLTAQQVAAVKRAWRRANGGPRRVASGSPYEPLAIREPLPSERKEN